MPLYGAALNGNEEVVSMLLAAGADLNLQKEVCIVCGNSDSALAKLNA